MVIYRIAKLPLLPNVHASEEGNQSAVSLKDPVRPLETIITNNTLKMEKKLSQQTSNQFARSTHHCQFVEWRNNINELQL